MLAYGLRPLSLNSTLISAIILLGLWPCLRCCNCYLKPHQSYAVVYVSCGYWTCLRPVAFSVLIVCCCNFRYHFVGVSYFIVGQCCMDINFSYEFTALRSSVGNINYDLWPLGVFYLKPNQVVQKLYLKSNQVFYIFVVFKRFAYFR